MQECSDSTVLCGLLNSVAGGMMPTVMERGFVCNFLPASIVCFDYRTCTWCRASLCIVSQYISVAGACSVRQRSTMRMLQPCYTVCLVLIFKLIFHTCKRTWAHHVWVLGIMSLPSHTVDLAMFCAAMLLQVCTKNVYCTLSSKGAPNPPSAKPHKRLQTRPDQTSSAVLTVHLKNRAAFES